MATFASEVWELQVGTSTVLFHALTGRAVSLPRRTMRELTDWSPELSPPPTLDAVVERLRRLHLLADGPPPDRSKLVPTRSRLVLTFPEVPALWLPLPTLRTPSGHAYAERPLTGTELELWRACDGTRTTAAVAAHLGIAEGEALAFFSELTHPMVQALQLRDEAVRGRPYSLQRLIAPDRMPRTSPADQPYRVYEITGIHATYDEDDARLSHTFSVPHPALGGQVYAERLHDVLSQRGWVPEDGSVVLIGADAEFARAWKRAATRADAWGSEIVRLTQAPTRQADPGIREVIGRPTELHLADASVPLVVCDDVASDLAQAGARPGELDPDPALQQRLRRYGFQTDGQAALYNLGAWQMLEEVARVLRPAGVGIVTGRGSLDEAVEETVVRNRPEFNLQFGHLLQVARHLGLDAQFVPLHELLQVDPTQPWLARHSFEALRARLVGQGQMLAATAWTPQTLELPWPVEGLDWVPVSEPGPGPLITTYGALVVRR